MQPLQAKSQNDTTTETKIVHPTKEVDLRITTEAKKKPVTDFKVKNEQKYQKLKDDDISRKIGDFEISMTSSTSPMVTSSSSSSNIDSSNVATRPILDSTSIPFLLHGEPIVVITTTKPNVTETISTSSSAVDKQISSTEGMQVTEETTSSRGRALNVSASEPMNSLHANITDLSDVSMDEDDKEVEGKI